MTNKKGISSTEAKNYKKYRIGRAMAYFVRITHKWSSGKSLEEKLVCGCCENDTFYHQKTILRGERKNELIFVQCVRCHAAYFIDYDYWLAVEV